MKTKQSLAKVQKDVPCPFCSIHCDDLVIQNQSGKLKVKENGCPISVERFERPLAQSTPTINGKTATLDEAISQAAGIFKKSVEPLIAGLGTDVGGMRSVMELADKTGSIIDHMHHDGAARNMLVLQDLGWVMTTMGEIRNRAELIIFAGTDASNYPRFYERVVWNEQSMFNYDTAKRDIVYIGENLDTSRGKSPTGKKPTHLKCPQDEIGEVISVLHALVGGNKTQKKDEIAGIKMAHLEKLAEQMKNTRYGVIVWAPGELDFPHAELTIQNFCEITKYLNRETRFAGFFLGGNDGGMSANNVSAWQSGFPLRVNFSKGYPEHDLQKYATANVLKNKEADALLWISSFNPEIKPPHAKIPTIVLATADTKLDFKPDVFIPVSTPGVDHSGQMIRTDSVVSLPLKQLRNSDNPSVKEVVRRIAELV
ncbi:MAG: formylmethanofuran dehydrogenase subunit B [Gammaproteobacteria bacterium]|nr:MAG: formylmethanofuran dehydrogenase subunit B [Gammaproteobacteria bacterium]